MSIVAAPARRSAMDWDLHGLACPYERWTRDEDDSRALHGGRRCWYERGAFGYAAPGTARLLIDHRAELQLASEADGTLRVRETSAGLWFEALLDGRPLADLAIRGVSEGIITGACANVTGCVDDTDATRRVRHVHRFDLSLMVSQWACFHESFVHVNRRQRGRLAREKQRLYEAMWSSIRQRHREQQQPQP